MWILTADIITNNMWYIILDTCKIGIFNAADKISSWMRRIWLRNKLRNKWCLRWLVLPLEYRVIPNLITCIYSCIRYVVTLWLGQIRYIQVVLKNRIRKTMQNLMGYYFNWWFIVLFYHSVGKIMSFIWLYAIFLCHHSPVVTMAADLTVI